MAADLNLRSKDFWRRLGWGLVVGLLSAIGAFVFLGLMNLGQSLLFPEQTVAGLFSGSWLVVVIMTVAGLLVGLIRRFTPAAQLDVFDAVDEGTMDPKPVPASLLASLVSLIGGFSLGPEVPSGMLAAGLGTWIAQRRKMDPDTTRTTVISGVSAAYAGLFSSPFAMLMILLESPHVQSVAYYGTLLIAGLAAVVGFALFYGLAGDTYSSMLGLLQPDVYDLKIWHLGVAILLGIVAAPVALLFPIMTKILSRLVVPLNSRPIVRGLLGGLLMGLLAMAVPLTVGTGTSAMAFVYDHAAEIGVALLVLIALAKLLALSGALAFGFVGGPIFPLLFVGTALGSALVLAFPQVPVGLAVGCLTAAVPAAVVPIPLGIAVIATVIMGMPPANALPLVVASLISFSIVRGVVLARGEKKEAQAE